MVNFLFDGLFVYVRSTSIRQSLGPRLAAFDLPLLSYYSYSHNSRCHLLPTEFSEGLPHRVSLFLLHIHGFLPRYQRPKDMVVARPVGLPGGSLFGRCHFRRILWLDWRFSGGRSAYVPEQIADAFSPT